MNNIFKKYKVFDIDSSLLRSDSFYKNLLSDRKSYWEERKVLLKKDKDATCVLCTGKSNVLELDYHGYKLFRCSDCNTVFPNINFENDYIKLVYDNNASEGVTKREVLDTYEYRKEKFGRERVRYMIEKCNFKTESDMLLDLGCGPGYFLKNLSEMGIKCKGLEVTQYLVDICRNQGLNVDSNLLEDETNEAYKVITMFDVLEHLTNPVDFFKTANKKLSNGGCILAYTPNINSFSFYFQGGEQNLLHPYEHVAFYSLRSLDYLANKTGFVIENIDYYGLDIVDYLSMKEYKDGVKYNNNLKEIVPYIQALIDKEGISNHMRIVFRKV